MTEKIISKRKIGMAVMLVNILFLLAAIGGIIWGATMSTEEAPHILLIASIIAIKVGNKLVTIEKLSFTPSIKVS